MRKKAVHRDILSCKASVACAVLAVLVAVFVLLTPISSQAASPKYKAVLIDASTPEEDISKEEEFGEVVSLLEDCGFKCYQFFYPDAKWSNIEPVLQDANLVIYSGHGRGYDTPVIDPDYDPEYANGWYIEEDHSYPDNGDWYSLDYHRRMGYIDQFVIQADVSLATNAVVFMQHACYSGGLAAGDSDNYSWIPGLEVCQQRIEDYGETFLDLGVNYVQSYSNNSPKEFFNSLLLDGLTLEESALDRLPSSHPDITKSVHKQYEHPEVKNKDVKFQYVESYCYEDYEQDIKFLMSDTDEVVAGDLDITASDILSGYVPPEPDEDPDEPNQDLPRQEPSPAVASNYSEYLLVSNPSSEAANVRVEFSKASGNLYYDFIVPAGGRYTLNVNEFAYLEDVSLKVISDVPVVAERAMYFDSGQGRTGGHDTSGLPELSKTWYFAEGYTAEAFDEYILMQNPNAEQVTATLTLMRDDGYTADFPYELGPYSRTTVHIDSLPEFGACSVSAKVTASQPIASERAMYFDYNGSKGGHCEHGIEAPSKEWYLAEGYTVGFVEINDGVTSFDSYILLQNPNDEPATVNVEFQREHGQIVPHAVTVPPNSRYTIPVDSIAGMESTAFSTHVTSDKDIIVERSMYFSYSGQTGGHVAAGLTQLSKQFYFAEGYTAGEFDTFLLLQNPNDEEISVNVTYNVDPSYGQPVTSSYTINPNSRFTVSVDTELPAHAFGMTLSSTDGSAFMAERAMYFNFGTSPNGNPITGGHDSTGVSTASTVWYFAEGYTGN